LLAPSLKADYHTNKAWKKKHFRGDSRRSDLADDNFADPPMRRRSAVPGRERWEAPALLRRPDLVARLERSLAGEPGILEAAGNPVTGRLLIRYDLSLTSDDVACLLHAAWSRALAGLQALAPARWRRPPEAPGEQESQAASRVASNLLLVGGAVAVGTLVLGQAALSAPVLLTAAAVATMATAVQWWRAWSRTRQGSANADTAESVRKFSVYAAKYSGRLRLAAFCCVVHKALDLASPLLVGLGLGIVAMKGSPLLTAIGLASPTSQVWFLGGLTVVVWMLDSWFERTYASLWRNAAQEIQHDLRMDAYAHVQRLSAIHLESESTGRIAAVLNDNINQIAIFMNEGVSNLIQMVTSFIVISVVYVVAAPGLAWAALLPIPVVLWGTFAFQEKVGPLYARVTERAGVMSGQLVNNLSGVATIRSYTAEQVEIGRLRRLSHDYLEANRDAIAVFTAFRPLIRLAVLIGFAGTIVFGGLQVLAGTLNPGVYALLLYLPQRLLRPIVYLGTTIDGLQKTMSAVGRVFDLLEAPVEPPGGRRALARDEVRGEIVFDDVVFAYREGSPVLESFSLQLRAGETTGIVGATGVGKTSMVKLLLRFYDWDSGAIRLDGCDLRAFRTRDVRQAISLVRQDEFLFSGTVRENIAYGRAAASLDEVVEAARVAQAHEFIAALPDGYDAVIGERGVKLSGGERQRICIARAILKDAPILIFDEATSSVDNETEAAIHRSLEQVYRDRTVLVITHRLSAVRNADAIHVLGEKGRIVEEGTHEDLVSAGGFYSALWRVQAGGDLG
jgi:ATP-binding cassette subfamily B protein